MGQIPDFHQVVDDRRHVGLESQQRFISSALAFTQSDKWPVRSCRVDNPTNQWLQLIPNADFVPPYSIGGVYRVLGGGSVNVIPNAPAGATQAAVVAGEQYVVTSYNRVLPVTQPFSIRSAGASVPPATAGSILFNGVLPSSIIVPAAQQWVITAGRWQFATSAVAGARLLVVDILDAGGNRVFTKSAPQTQIASLTQVYALMTDLASNVNVVGGITVNEIMINDGLSLGPGWSFRVRDANVIDVAGDSLSQAALAFRQL